MRISLESEFKTSLKRWLTDRGAYVVRTVIGGMGEAGTPDLLVCHRGRFIGVEVKRSPKLKATPWQERRLAEIRKAGGLAIVVHPDNVSELARLMGVDQ
jgi:Holliday junction resolvase